MEGGWGDSSRAESPALVLDGAIRLVPDGGECTGELLVIAVPWSYALTACLSASLPPCLPACFACRGLGGWLWIQVRRSNLLEDSMAAMESVRSESMRERFRFEFIGEPGVDAGGVAREWFLLVSEG